MVVKNVLNVFVANECHRASYGGRKAVVHSVEIEALQVGNIPGDVERENLPIPVGKNFIPMHKSAEKKATL